MRRFMKGFIGLTIAAWFTVGLQLPIAHAAFDQTPPSLTVTVRPAFVVENIVTDSQILHRGEPHRGERLVDLEQVDVGERQL